MNAETRKRIKLNRLLRAAPGRRRAYRVAKWRGDLDGVLRALYPPQPWLSTVGILDHIGRLPLRPDLSHPFMSLERKADARPWLDGGSGPR